MSTKFHILQSNDIITGSFYDELRLSLEEADQKCRQKLTLADIDVVVMHVPWQVIPRLGITGFSYDAHQVSITLDRDHEYLKANLKGVITSILAHELHHCARSLAFNSSGLGKTLGSGLVAEGLACCFEEEIGQSTPFYATICSGEALAQFARRAKPHINTKREDLPGGAGQWIYGRYDSKSGFPYLCGYSMGYALVREWLDRHDRTASQAAGIDQNEILEGWLSGKTDPFSESLI